MTTVRRPARGGGGGRCSPRQVNGHRVTLFASRLPPPPRPSRTATSEQCNRCLFLARSAAVQAEGSAGAEAAAEELWTGKYPCRRRCCEADSPFSFTQLGRKMTRNENVRLCA